MRSFATSLLLCVALSACTTKTGTSASSTSSASSISSASSVSFSYPLSRAEKRVTKKFFGTFVTPKNSPVQPERFTGYHTGIDFETFSDEQDSAIPVSAVCDGTALYSHWVSGYGGVFIQSCMYQGQPVTVLYGHLLDDSILPKLGTEVRIGQMIGNLGKGFTNETDGERKHLHLSVHKGTGIELKGYVQNKADLANWIDPYEI